MTLTPIQQALVERASDDRRPLHPEDPADAAVLLRAETLVRHGLSGGHALERVRTQPTSIADLRGIVRFARARHEHDQLAGCLDEHGLDLYDLTREQLVAAANGLFRIPADPLVEITVEDILKAFPGSYEVDQARELAHDDGPEFGRVVGACARCGAVIRSKQPTAVFYDRASTPEWRVIVVDDGVTQRDTPRATLQALIDGAPALCLACTVRMQQKLIVWKDGAFHHVIYEDDVTPITTDIDELDAGWVAGVDRDRKLGDVVEPAVSAAATVEAEEEDTLTFEELARDTRYP
jgi:hypothetical protein